MSLSLKPEHLKRYKDIAQLLVKYGRGDLAKAVDVDESLLADELAEWKDADGKPEELAADLERLGPTFVKLGQILSSRSDLLPAPYLEALARLQDEVEPFPYADIERMVAEELGVRISKAFEHFDAQPLAAASLGQVHRARLRDGREVVVKVQRPGIRRQILEDLDAFDEIAGFFDRHTEAGRRYALGEILEEFRRSLLRELDYRLEAQNLVELGGTLAKFPHLDVPAPIPDYSTSRVLTMEYLAGVKVTDLSPVARVDLDGAALADELARAYMDGILVDGFFHADPHPGNVLVTPEGHLAIVDLGLAARIDPQLQEQLLKLVLAVSEGRGYEVARLAIQLGTPLDDFAEDHFNREVSDLVGSFQGTTLEHLNIGRVMLELAQRSVGNGLRPPVELAMLGKTLLHVDEIGRTLAPDFEPNEAIRRHADSLMRRHMLKSFAPGQFFSALLEINELMQQLPARINRLFEMAVKGKLSVRVDVLDEHLLMNNLQKIANRISMGLILASLIVGAALMMRVQTSFTLLGYPGIAMLLFLAAAAIGFYLVGSIVYQDLWKEGRNNRRSQG